MYNDKAIDQLVVFLQENQGLDKANLSKLVMKKYNLTKDRSVFYCDNYAIRFSSAKKLSAFSNCVLSLSNLRKFDDRPFIVCLVLPNENYLYLANTSCLSKISHSSHDLRVNNIRGTFLGHDIMRDIDGIKNSPENFKDLFLFHEQFGFEGNLERLVEATNNIVGTKTRVQLNDKDIKNILESPKRAQSFINSNYFIELSKDLCQRVSKVKNEICIAAWIDNVNIRGRVIEYLITAESGDEIKRKTIEALNNKTNLPPIITKDKLGDYSRSFKDYITETDIKTKILFLDANPKAYNIDKILEFLSDEKSVYLLYFVGVNSNNEISTRLCSMFEYDLLNNTKSMKHWAGRNTRGVTQFYGHIIKDLLTKTSNHINLEYAIKRLKEMINL